MKKLLLLLIFLTTTLFSFEIEMWQENNNAILKFNTFSDNVGGDEGTNWVAIYKEGDSNDWDNVITWAWAKDLALNETGNSDERIFPLVTDEGSYEVRFFLDNSYDVFQSFTYNNGEGTDTDASIKVSLIYEDSIIFNSTMGEKAWIAIFQKGATSNADNVETWAWVESSITIFPLFLLHDGTYEARLFYNGSYEEEASVEFTINKNNKNSILWIDEQTDDKITFTSHNAMQAWIGIYNKGDSSDWENVKAWDWVDNPTTIDISDLAQGTYEARLFYNNSYEIEKVVEFTKEGK